MKNSIRKAAIVILSFDVLWYMVRPLIKIAEFLRFQREISQQYKVVHNADTDLILSILKEPVVKNGPFRGLRYPAYQSFGSSIFPKIIGSYERELESVVRVIQSTEYSEILDIGCAEGYYAVGLALVKPHAQVYAYDTDIKARKACKQMAELNKVTNRVQINRACTPADIATFPFSGRGLIICDCEGYEKELFNQTNISNLANCDLLVETHDFISPGISTYLEDLFKGTHRYETISSVDDVQKVKMYHYDETKDLNLFQKRQVFGEGRPAIMEWYWFRPLQNS